MITYIVVAGVLLVVLIIVTRSPRPGSSPEPPGPGAPHVFQCTVVEQIVAEPSEPLTLVIDVAPAGGRLKAAKSLLDEFSRAASSRELPDYDTWARRLAGALESVTSLAREAITLNTEMSDLLEQVLIMEQVEWWSA
jgi:hypothetical protein